MFKNKKLKNFLTIILGIMYSISASATQKLGVMENTIKKEYIDNILDWTAFIIVLGISMHFTLKIFNEYRNNEMQNISSHIFWAVLYVSVTVAIRLVINKVAGAIII